MTISQFRKLTNKYREVFPDGIKETMNFSNRKDAIFCVFIKWTSLCKIQYPHTPKQTKTHVMNSWVIQHLHE